MQENKKLKLKIVLLALMVGFVVLSVANGAETKAQQEFARICSELESYIKNPDKMPLQPIDEWSELMVLVKKQREAKNLTADEKSKMDELKNKEWKAMGKFVSVGTGPNSLEWKKLEETTEKINILTLVVISTIQDAYALATGKTPKEIKDNVWVKHPTEDRMVFNKAGFEKLAEDTKGDKNFARLLQTGGIVDELFKRYEMFFRMTDWKAVNEDFKNISLSDQGTLAKLARDNNRNQATLFHKNWDGLRFDSIGSENSEKLVMNYRMSNLVHIQNIFTDLLLERQDFPDDLKVVNDFETLISTYVIFSANKLNYKAN